MTTMVNNPSLCSWSGGKDSCFALIKAEQEGFIPTVLLNVLNEEGKISRSHGIPSAVLQRQAELAGIPIRLISSSWADYETKFTDALINLKTRFNVSHAVFGDIDLQSHRDWEEKVCSNAGLEAVLPLWQIDRERLLDQMLDGGIETMIISCNEVMGEKFLGQILTKDLAEELKLLDVDVCGENGEFHTLVLNCSLFSQKLEIKKGAKLHHEGYWFLQVSL
ncbi:diphthine--ammonia ligase [Pollutibacter soli]|uniref:Dph6-related ATP pyrophosphatase n=1 Tax=Pollutibacter soli TaxID=3034157 RepID=UPI00301381ED